MGFGEHRRPLHMKPLPSQTGRLLYVAQRPTATREAGAIRHRLSRPCRSNAQIRFAFRIVRKLTQQLIRGRGDAPTRRLRSRRTVTFVDGKLSPKNMRGELAQARPVTFSVAATAAGTRIKLAWRETGSVSAHRPSDPGDLSRLGGPNSIDLKS